MAEILPFLPYIIGAVALVVIVGLVAVGVAARSESDPLQDRLAEFVASQAEDISSLEELEMSVPFSQRVLLPVMQAIASLTQSFTPEEALTTTQRRIDLAGNPSGLTPPVFWAVRRKVCGTGCLSSPACQGIRSNPCSSGKNRPFSDR